MRKIELTGKKFGMISVVEEYKERSKYGAVMWLCKCDCGNTTIVLSDNLLRGNSKSCGCTRQENFLKAVTRHGLSKHPLHHIWRNMLMRCNNMKDLDYGGRGVRVCDEWNGDFMAFYNWCIANGWQKGLQLDKDIKAKELGVKPLLYSPERCQFVTPKKNSRNRRNSRFITCRGLTMTLSEFAELVGEKSDIIHYRMRHGWTEEEAIFTPFKRRRKANA